MKKSTMLAVILGFSALFAAPVEKVDPVASGYPVWTGLTAKNYLCGRWIEPSDLRHKVTIVVEVEPNEKLFDQLVSAASLVRLSSLCSMSGEGANWEDAELPRDIIAAVSVRGTMPKMSAHLMDVLNGVGKKEADKDAVQALAIYKGSGCSVYRNLSFVGAPETADKRPYVYIFGPSGAEPLCQGSLDAVQKDALAAVEKGKKEINGWEQKWKPFFGNIAEPKFNTSLAKTLEKGRAAKKASLVGIEKSLLGDVRSKDEEKARESQVLYDALVQTRNDLALRINLEASVCPHRAYYDIQTLFKHWPTMTKSVEGAMARMKANSSADTMGKIFVKLMAWGDPAFACKPAEAKKIVAELNKIKKSLGAAKESKDLAIQNCALLLDMRADGVLSAMQARVEAK